MRTMAPLRRTTGRSAQVFMASLPNAVSLLVTPLSLYLHWWAQAWKALPGKTWTQQMLKATGGRRGGEQGPLTVIGLVRDPAVLSVLMYVVGVPLGTLLGAEVLVGPRALLAVADLVLEHGP